MSAVDDDTREVLRRWCAGDPRARAELVRRHLPWVTRQVRRLLGPKLLAKEDQEDFVQHALLEFLRYCPKFGVESGAQLRAILLKVIHNTIRDRSDWYEAWRRKASKEQPLPSDTVLHLCGEQAYTPPDERAHKNEMAALLRLALELLEPERRWLIVQREMEGRSYADLAAELGVPESTAKKRFQRAVASLASTVERLRRGEIP